MPADVRVAIVGGGLSGLFTAIELTRRGIDDVRVLEASESPGGVTNTIHRDGFALEPAAGTLMLPHAHLSPLLEHVGADVVPARSSASQRYVYTRDRLVALPSSPRALFAPLVPLSAKLRGAVEPFVRTPPQNPDESLDSFLRRRLGDGLGRTLAWVAASGVFAGDPQRLSARAAFPALPALEDRAGSIVRGGLRRLRDRKPGSVRPTSHLPVGGMSALVETLTAHLAHGVSTSFEVSSVEPGPSGWVVSGTDEFVADQVVLAVAPQTAASLVGGELSDLLSRAKAAPVVTAGLGGDEGEVPIPSGFGMLTGPDVRAVTRGVLFESSYAAERAPEGHHLAKVIAGGAVSPDVVDWEDDRILDTVIREMSQMLRADVSPSFTHVVRHRPGIPQYEVGHLEWISHLDRTLESTPGLHLTGWGYRGVGVAHLAADAVAVAERVLLGD